MLDAAVDDGLSLDTGRLSVRRAADVTTRQAKTTKTGSARVLDLDNETLAGLKAYKVKRGAISLGLSPAPMPTCSVMTLVRSARRTRSAADGSPASIEHRLNSPSCRASPSRACGTRPQPQMRNLDGAQRIFQHLNRETALTG